MKPRNRARLVRNMLTVALTATTGLYVVSFFYPQRTGVKLTVGKTITGTYMVSESSLSVSSAKGYLGIFLSSNDWSDAVVEPLEIAGVESPAAPVSSFSNATAKPFWQINWLSRYDFSAITRPKEPRTLLNLLGFGLYESRSWNLSYQRGLFFPHWLVVLFLALAVLYLQRYSEPRRTGICSTCWYDLTGNLSGVCPECGTAIPVKGETKG